MQTQDEQRTLLQLLKGSTTPKPEELRRMCAVIDSHQVLAKVFLLEGVPYVFKESPMKYVIFREQVADRFDVGSQDVCIVGSAKLGYSPSPTKFGVPFHEESDVDVVIVSEPLFYRGSRELFEVLNAMGPRPLWGNPGSSNKPMSVDNDVWTDMKQAIRNFVYENFNPGLLPFGHPSQIDIFDRIKTTSGLFLALEPQVFVSKIRCRIFRTWKSAENYYANSLREAGRYFREEAFAEIEPEDADNDRSSPPAAGISAIAFSVGEQADRLKSVSREAVVVLVRDSIRKYGNDPDLLQLYGASLRKWAVEAAERDPERATKLIADSIKAHQRALETHRPDIPKHLLAGYHYALGRSFLQAEMTAEAIASFQEALNVDPEYSKAKDYLEKVASKTHGAAAAV